MVGNVSSAVEASTETATPPRLRSDINRKEEAEVGPGTKDVEATALVAVMAQTKVAAVVGKVEIAAAHRIPKGHNEKRKETDACWG